MDKKEYFLNRKPAETLVLIYESDQDVFNSLISKRIDTTYSHTVEIVQTLESEGLIETEKKGRKKISVLSDRGEEYAEAFKQVLDVIESDNRVNKVAETS